MQPYVRDTITHLIAPLLDQRSNRCNTWGLLFFMEAPKQPAPFSAKGLTKSAEVLPRLLRLGDYSLEWLHWASEQTYLSEVSLKAINNRIKEIQNG